MFQKQRQRLRASEKVALKKREAKIRRGQGLEIIKPY